MHPAESWDMIRARQRRATFKRREKLIDRKERRMQAFSAFLIDFVRDLNHLSEAGWSLLIEGPRDEKALRKLGYRGPAATVSSVVRIGPEVLGNGMKVVILTDLDREGSVLAARYVKKLNHEGFRTSLSERRRLKSASRGVFLHVENLSRFGEHEEDTELGETKVGTRG